MDFDRSVTLTDAAVSAGERALDPSGVLSISEAIKDTGGEVSEGVLDSLGDPVGLPTQFWVQDFPWVTEVREMAEKLVGADRLPYKSSERRRLRQAFTFAKLRELFDAATNGGVRVTYGFEKGDTARPLKFRWSSAFTTRVCWWTLMTRLGRTRY